MTGNTLAPAADAVAIQGVFEAIGCGFRDRDAAAIVRHYADDALIADLAPPLQRTGLDVAGLQEWLDGWDGPVLLTLQDILVDVSGDLAICHGLLHTEAGRGGEPVGWWARITSALRRFGDDWLVIHEHVSVPFHMDGSFRAAIDLEPDTPEAGPASP